LTEPSLESAPGLLAPETEARVKPSRDSAAHRHRMSRNVEVKARAGDVDAVEARARAIAEQGPFDLEQDDTFFACSNGRLKLRELGPDRGELIFYRRLDVEGPKLSEYVIAPTTAPAAMREALGRALGVIGRVRKRRRLYLVGTTRIHLDQVDGLGMFAELEVVLSSSQSVADGEAMARHLISALGLSDADLEPRAYIDLLLEGGGRATGATAASSASSAPA
jgi:predicted adenylyl cyclase CyaB